MTGRPRKEIPFEKLKTLMRLRPSLEDTAAFFETNATTIEQVIKRETGLTFFEFRDQNLVHSRMNLIRKALEKAYAGDNVMLIFCLKNLCGWTNQNETMALPAGPSAITLSYDPNKKLFKEPTG